MKKLIASLLIIAVFKLANAQSYYTKNGYVSFHSKALIEDIKADNNQLMCVLNAQSGQLQFSLLIKNFHFDKALMEEHFNENYMESDKYPRAAFKGTILDMDSINFLKDGNYLVRVTGDLSMHGVTRKTSATGTISIKTGKIFVHSTFVLNLADYGITISKTVKNNISQTPGITISCSLDRKI
jgi:hypothetical protein